MHRVQRVRRLAALVSAAAVAAIGTVVAAPAVAAAPTELFFSEYIEGSSNNKALEIFNGTGAAVDLAAGGYNVQMFFNGSGSAGLTIDLTGTVASGDVFVLAQSAASAAILAQADQTNGAGFFNGDDAVVLRKGTTVLDVIGQIGFDPGSQWGSDLTSTADNTLQRKSTVCAGDADGTDAFDPSVEWEGFATDTFDGLGAHTADCSGGTAAPVINEFSASTTGTDVEYVEIFGSPSTDYSAYTVLEIEGDTTGAGVVDEVIPLGTTDTNGLYLVNLAANALENGTISLLLVKDFTGALGNDLDTDNDGVFDVVPWAEIVDSIAVDDGGAGDVTYGVPVLGPNYDGLSSFAPGGASRIPDGFDTDAATDWVRNDFDLAGIPGFTGSLIVGEAYNTPGAPNAIPDPSGCDLPTVPISTIQGDGDATPCAGLTVTTTGVVVGDYEYDPNVSTLRGFYLQDPVGDGDSATSDGLFVFNGNNDSVSLGDVVRVTGAASEFQGQTQISAASIVVEGTGTVAPVDVTFPRTAAGDLEPYEGMLVTLPQTMYVTEHFQLGRFGQVVVSSGGRLQQPTNVVEPGAPALALQAANDLNRIIIDDHLQNQNPDPIVFGREGAPLSASNTLRGGDTTTGTTGVMTYTWAGNSASGNAFRLRPINALNGHVYFDATNPRPISAPDAGGSIQVAGMNLLNYFNTFDGLPDTVDNCTLGVGGAATDCRGADTQEEFDRQWPKTVAAINGTGADVVGVMEVENDGYGAASAIAHLVWQLNEATADGTWAFIDADAATGQVNALGVDAIKVGLLYRPAEVTPVGTTAALNSEEFVYAGDDEPRNRPALAQAFRDNETGGVFTVAVNHLKSKGSACDDPDALDGQGNCNVVRTIAAGLLAEWLAGDPTGTGDTDTLIMGDLNAYAMEDPIRALQDAGYTNLILEFGGLDAYSYVFDGQWGYLDHALGTASIAPQVTGVAEWHINADEPSVLDYNTNFKSPDQVISLYAPDQFRMSDHDPVIVGLNLASDYTRFVVGGGWFDSPAGSLVSDPMWAGKATFGLSVKYETGMTVPTGDFDFNLVGAPFKAYATGFDWLVVSGDWARFAGSAMVNDVDGYTFDVTVTDGGKRNDRIAVVIRDPSGVVVYDSDGSQTVKGQLTLQPVR